MSVDNSVTVTPVEYKYFTIVIYDRNVQFTITMTVASTIKLRS